MKSFKNYVESKMVSDRDAISIDSDGAILYNFTRTMELLSLEDSIFEFIENHEAPRKILVALEKQNSIDFVILLRKKLLNFIVRDQWSEQKIFQIVMDNQNTIFDEFVAPGSQDYSKIEKSINRLLVKGLLKVISKDYPHLSLADEMGLLDS